MIYIGTIHSKALKLIVESHRGLYREGMTSFKVDRHVEAVTWPRHSLIKNDENSSTLDIFLIKLANRISIIHAVAFL